MPLLTRRSFLRQLLRGSGLLAASALLPACLPATPTPESAEAPAATSAVATPPPTGAASSFAPETPRGEEMALQGVADVALVAKEIGEDAINDTPNEYGVWGADLGSMFDKDGKVYMVFGDTFGCCIPGTGGPGTASDWRCNTMAIITDREPSDGLRFDSMITDRPGHAGELLPRGPGDATVIPTYGVAIGGRMFLHYMAVRAWGSPGAWTLNESGLATSDDDGVHWNKAPQVRWDGRSNFGQVAIVAWEGEVYFFGIPGGRFGGVKLAKVNPDAILNLRQYRYFAGLAGTTPEWRADEREAVWIVPAPVGELSVLWNGYLNRWIMTYLDETRAAIVIREAPELWGPWSRPLTLVSGRAYPGLYGAYMHRWYVENEGEVIYFTMSRWQPYSVFLMRARLVKR